MILARTARTTREAAPLLVAAAVFTAAGGFVHLREWLDGYRDVPASAPGAFVVRIGFPLHAAASLVLACALTYCALRATRLLPLVLVATASFQAASLAVVILTRTGTVFGWTEPIWTRGADQSRAVAVGALLALGAAAWVAIVDHRATRARRQALTVSVVAERA